jgi:hypothetical protein
VDLREVQRQLRSISDALDDGSDWRVGRTSLEREFDLAVRRWEIAVALGVNPRLQRLLAEHYATWASLSIWQCRDRRHRTIAAQFADQIDPPKEGN